MQSTAKIQKVRKSGGSSKARDYSGDELLVMAARRFCGLETIERLKIEQFKEAFYGLVGQVSPQTLSEVSSILCRHAFVPREIMFYLACEPLHIAEPMLTQSTVPTQLDLLQIIGKTKIEHTRAIATRPDLGPALVQHLRRLNDKKVLELLASNSAVQAIEPVEQSIDQPDQADSAEHETKNETAMVGKNATAPTISYTISRKKPANKVAAAEKQRPSNKLLEAANRGGRIAKEATSTSPVQSTERRSPSLATAMEQAALKGSRQSMAVLMQREFGLALEACHQVFEDKSGDALAVFMKAANFDDQSANRITLLTFPTIGLSVKNARRAIHYYQNLDSNACRLAVNKWPKSSKPQMSQHVPIYSDDAQTRLSRSGVSSNAPAAISQTGSTTRKTG